MENIIEFPAKEAGANKTIASEVELAQAVGNENVSTYGYHGVEKVMTRLSHSQAKKDRSLLTLKHVQALERQVLH